MKFRIVLILPLYLLLGCGKQVDNVGYHIDPTLKPYVDMFYAEAENRGVQLRHDDLVVQFEDSDELEMNSEAGKCTNHNVVTISQMKWNFDLNGTGDYYEYNKRDLMFHELGHCLLGRGHNTAQTVSTAPIGGGHFKRSIMYPTSGIYTDFYVPHYQEYLDEMFGLSQGPN